MKNGIDREGGSIKTYLSLRIISTGIFCLQSKCPSHKRIFSFYIVDNTHAVEKVFASPVPMAPFIRVTYPCIRSSSKIALNGLAITSTVLDLDFSPIR